MPLYEYLCLDCNQRFDALRPMKDADAPIQCTACRGKHTSRLLSLFNARSGGKSIASSQSCAGCSAGSCSGCGR